MFYAERATAPTRAQSEAAPDGSCPCGFDHANIRVINRRESSSLSSARLSELSTLKAHQQERVPATPLVGV